MSVLYLSLLAFFIILWQAAVGIREGHRWCDDPYTNKIIVNHLKYSLAVKLKSVLFFKKLSYLLPIDYHSNRYVEQVSVIGAMCMAMLAVLSGTSLLYTTLYIVSVFICAVYLIYERALHKVQYGKFFADQDDYNILGINIKQSNRIQVITGFLFLLLSAGFFYLALL